MRTEAKGRFLPNEISWKPLRETACFGRFPRRQGALNFTNTIILSIAPGKRKRGKPEEDWISFASTKLTGQADNAAVSLIRIKA